LKKRCFVICPIGSKDSDIRKRSDQILKYVINPAAESCGYEVIRGDQIDSPGMITSQVIQHLLEDELTIADLTGRNPNVFYELALRHAIGKPIIHIKEISESIPFDVLGIRIIDIDSRYIDDIEKAKETIKDYIKTIESNPNKIDENPITISKNSITISSLINDLKNIQSQIDTKSSNNNKSLSNNLTSYYNQKIDEAIQELSNLGDLKEKASSIKILWVDDFPANNKSIMDIYKNIGVQFDVAIDNEYAFDLLEKNKYNLVITDMGRHSENMAGISLIKNIKKMPINLKPPVILYASQKAISMYGSLARAEGVLYVTSSAKDLVMTINQIISA
jgi:CheY-like chemotaxis protein